MRGPYLLLAALALGCGGTSASPTFIDPCAPGQSIACGGVGGCSGAQVCSPGGTGYGPCECSPDAVPPGRTHRVVPLPTPGLLRIRGVRGTRRSLRPTRAARLTGARSPPTRAAAPTRPWTRRPTIRAPPGHRSTGDDASCFPGGSDLPAGSYQETCRTTALAGGDDADVHLLDGPLPARLLGAGTPVHLLRSRPRSSTRTASSPAARRTANEARPGPPGDARSARKGEDCRPSAAADRFCLRMIEAPIPSDEATRLELLKACKIMYTPAEEAFDDVARPRLRTFAARRSRSSPWSTLRLPVDSRRASASSRWRAPRATLSFLLGHCIAGSHAIVVEDTREDPRFADNPLVTGDPYLRFYAGVPLEESAPGSAVGALSMVAESDPAHARPPAARRALAARAADLA